MKRIISLALALLMLTSLFSVSIFAEDEEKSEVISFEEINRKETEHFILTTNDCDSNGWRGGSNYFELTIATKDSNIIITHIEADIGAYGYLYDMVGIKGGSKREKGSVNNGDTVHIDNINKDTFSFSGGKIDINFKDITVFYKSNHTHNFGENYKCTVCGKTKCEIEGQHSYNENNTCINCGLTKCEIEGHHSFGDDNKCTICSLTKCEIEGHPSYKHGFCTFCGQKCVEENFETFNFVQENRVEKEHFILTTNYYDSNGWRGGSNNYELTITAKDSNIIITHIDADIGDYGYLYNMVGIKGGSKREKGSVNNVDTVHIDNINQNTFSFSGGSIDISFKDITIYYINEHIHSYGEGNVCTICNKSRCEIEGQHSYNENNTCINCGLTKCEIEGHHSYGEGNVCVNCSIKGCNIGEHSLDNGFCKFCDFFDESKHKHIFDGDNKCVCGMTKCKVDGHSYKHGFCTFCGQKCVEEKFETIGFVQNNTVETEHFILTTYDCDSNGWCGGDNTYKLTIKAKDSNIIITHIDADIGAYGILYDRVGIVGGEKREKGSVNDGDTVHIDNINKDTFSFGEGVKYINFKDITVFYEYTNGTGSTISEGNIWIIAGIGVVAVVALAVIVAKKKKKTA